MHQDVMVQNHTHVGLIYLTPNPEKDSGTILYEPKKDLDPEAFAKNNGDPCHYDIADVAENVFNRCIIYSPDSDEVVLRKKSRSNYRLSSWFKRA